MFLLGGDLNSKLLKAAKLGDTDAIETLVSKGADVNAKDDNGITALMFASYYCNFDTVGLLLDKGAEVSEKNNFGETALMMIETGLYPEITELLKEHDAKE